MSVATDELFTFMSDFYLNQLLGYQDMNELKEGLNRLEAAIADQHAWDRGSNNAAWAGDHADPASGPAWDLGSHAGHIGIDSGVGQTVYWGDGKKIRTVLKYVQGTATQTNEAIPVTTTLTSSDYGASTTTIRAVIHWGQGTHTGLGANLFGIAVFNGTAGQAAGFQVWDRSGTIITTMSITAPMVTINGFTFTANYASATTINYIAIL